MLKLRKFSKDDELSKLAEKFAKEYNSRISKAIESGHSKKDIIDALNAEISKIIAELESNNKSFSSGRYGYLFHVEYNDGSNYIYCSSSPAPSESSANSRMRKVVKDEKDHNGNEVKSINNRITFDYDSRKEEIEKVLKDYPGSKVRYIV